MDTNDLKTVSTAALAYLGDCVMELCVREYLVERGLSSSARLNAAALDFVRAPKQAEAMQRIYDLLDEEEMVQTTPFSIATGVSAAPFLREIVDIARANCDKIDGQVYAVENDFFGHTIVVAGLVTGGDLIAQMKGKQLGERLLISASMLRSGERVFLDDVTLDDVERELGVPVIPVAQDGYELCDAIFGLHNGQPPVSCPVPEDEYYRYNPGVR